MAYEQSLYNEVKMLYDEIRHQNEQDLALRIQNVYDKIPEIKEIDEEIKSLGLKLFKLAVSKSPDMKSKVFQLRASQKELLKKRTELLLKNGFHTILRARRPLYCG